MTPPTLLTPDNCQLIIIDHQPQMAFGGCMDIVREHFGAYGMGMDYAYTMVHKAPERVEHGPVEDPIAA